MSAWYEQKAERTACGYSNRGAEPICNAPSSYWMWLSAGCAHEHLGVACHGHWVCAEHVAAARSQGFPIVRIQTIPAERTS